MDSVDYENIRLEFDGPLATLVLAGITTPEEVSRVCRA